jgi:hypothetical protein
MIYGFSSYKIGISTFDKRLALNISNNAEENNICPPCYLFTSYNALSGKKIIFDKYYPSFQDYKARYINFAFSS